MRVGGRLCAQGLAQILAAGAPAHRTGRTGKRARRRMPVSARQSGVAAIARRTIGTVDGGTIAAQRFGQNRG